MTGLFAGALALPLALLLDRLVGDPQRLWARIPHPVALIGRVIDVLEHSMNDLARPFAARRRRGLLALAILVAAAALAGSLLHLAISALPLSQLVEALVASVLLAQKSLLVHVRAVWNALEHGGVEGGRDAVALIVGRDVSQLDEAGVARAAIESLAENFSDGVIAPAFWFLLFGLPGLLVYKAVNTADSMIGHRSPRFEAFGWAAARLDDLLNLVPSRLSAALVPAAAILTGADARNAAVAALRDARLHRSPNAGWPEAAAAGALGLALGGPRRYGVSIVEGAWLNPGGRRQAGIGDVKAAVRLIDFAWVVLFAAAALIALATWL